MKDLKRSLAVLLTLCMVISAFSWVTVSNSKEVSADESNYDSMDFFHLDWKYYKGDLTGAEDKDFDDSSWEYVNIPHSTKWITPDDFEAYLGVSWYRKTITIDPAVSGQKIYIEIEAAMQCADVWVNGVKVSNTYDWNTHTHEGGYLGFTIDVTDMVTLGEANVIAVKIDSRSNSNWSPGSDGRDMQYLGGLYRDVYMYTKETVHITDAVYNNETASGGIFVTYPNDFINYDSKNAEKADVNIKTHIKNEASSNESITVISEIVDADGNVVATGSETETISTGDGHQFNQDFTLSNAKLWHPDQPYLYTLNTTVIQGGVTVDTESTRIGIRRINWTYDDGLEINGERFYATGTNLHQDIFGLGNAMPNSVIYNEVKRVKEAGFDFIRGSHYPHDPAFYDACDELGVIVLNSITGWQNSSIGTEGSQLRNNIYQEVRDMIRRDRNHPSVVAWETSLNESSAMTDAFVTEMVNIAKAEYPNDQMFTAVYTSQNSTFTSNDIDLKASQHGARTTSSTSKAIIISEYGDWDYGGSSSTSRQERGDGDNAMLTEASNREESLNYNLSKSYFSADGLWHFTDYSPFSSEKTVIKSGVLDMYRLEKYSYYFFQSQRDADYYDGIEELEDVITTRAVLKIANQWISSSPSTVRVYSNADKVEMYVDGNLVATQTPDTNFPWTVGSGNSSGDKGYPSSTEYLNHPAFNFDLSSYTPGQGEIKAIAYINDEAVAEETVKAPGTATNLRIRADSDTAIVGDGSDLKLVWVDVVDANGTVVPDATNSIKLSVVGSGAVEGEPVVNAVGGQIGFWVRSNRSGSGTATVVATSDGLTPDIYDIDVTVVDNVPEEKTQPEKQKTNLALGKPVTASSEESDKGNIASNVTDGSTSTRWCGTSQNEHWLIIDLGAKCDITDMMILWEKADVGYPIKIQTSINGSTWTDIEEGTTPTGGTSTHEVGTTGRYVRIYASGTDSTVWPSIYETEIYGTQLEEASNDVLTDMAREMPAYATSSQSLYPAEYGNLGSPGDNEQWRPESTDSSPAWWVDMGDVYNIQEINFNVFSSSAFQYVLESSINGETWVTLADKSENTEVLSGTVADTVSGLGRYLRITFTGGFSDSAPVAINMFKAFCLSADNLLEGSIVNVDSTEGDNILDNFMDNDTSTYWSSDENSRLYWMMLNTQSVSAFKGTKIDFAEVGVYKYKIYTSLDGTNWSLEIDNTNNTDVISEAFHALSTNSQYITVIFEPDDNSIIPKIAEWKVYGSKSTSTEDGENLLQNPGFEETNGSGNQTTIPGWTNDANPVGAGYTQSSNQYSGSRCMSHWRSSAYVVDQYQKVENLVNGKYTFSFYSNSNGDDQNELYAYVSGYGGEIIKLDLPSSGGYTYYEIQDIEVTTGEITVGFYGDGNAGNWANFDDTSLVLVAASTGETAEIDFKLSGDKTDLTALYKEVRYYDKDTNDDSSWNQFETALAEAKALLRDSLATQSELDTALSNLQSAVTALNSKIIGVDKTDLEDKIDYVLSLNADSYTANSWASLQIALASAEAVLSSSEATYAEVASKAASLQNAIDALVKVSKSSLENLVKRVSGISSDGYSNDSWAVFETALSEAQTVLANGNATQAEVDSVYEALKEAYAALKELDKTTLSALVEYANAKYNDENKGLYTNSSWSAYQTSLSDATNLLDNNDIEQSDLTNSFLILKSAMNSLSFKSTVDKTVLKDLYDGYSDKTNDNYTDESWKAFEAALEQAKAVINSDEATEEEVENAVTALKAAADGLTKNSGESSSQQSSSDPSGSEPSSSEPSSQPSSSQPSSSTPSESQPSESKPSSSSTEQPSSSAVSSSSQSSSSESKSSSSQDSGDNESSEAQISGNQSGVSSSTNSEVASSVTDSSNEESNSVSSTDKTTSSSSQSAGKGGVAKTGDIAITIFIILSLGGLVIVVYTKRKTHKS